MKKNKILFVTMLVLILSLFPASAYSTNEILAILFPAHVQINHQPHTEMLVLNYKDRTYVPLRTFAEQMGGIVTYDAPNRQINVAYNNDQEQISEIQSSITDGDFTLALYSNHKTLDQGQDDLHVWGTLTYHGQDPITIGHGNPVLGYTIEDQQGNIAGTITLASRKNQVLQKNSTITSVMPISLRVDFNQFKGNGSTPEQWIKDHPRPWLLDPGSYAIGVQCDVSVEDGSRLKLATTLPITIE